MSPNAADMSFASSSVLTKYPDFTASLALLPISLAISSTSAFALVT